MQDRRSVRALVLLYAFVLLMGSGLCQQEADINGDGKVDASDLALLISSWRQFKANEPGWDTRADVDTDGDLDREDARIVLEAFLSLYRPVARIADYWPLTAGDQRLWVDKEGFLANRQEVWGIAAGSQGAGGQTFSVETRSPCGEKLFTSLERIENGRVVLLGFEDENGKFSYDPSVMLPEEMRVNDKASFEVSILQDGTPVGRYSLELWLRGAEMNIETPAKTFSQCAWVELSEERTINAQTLRRQTWLFLARGVGPIKMDKAPGSNTQVFGLQYAKVGSKTFGTKPSVSLAQLWPIGEGSVRIWERSDGVWGGSRVIGTKNLLGRPVAVEAAFRLPLGSEATYHCFNQGYVTGYAGEKWPQDDLDHVLDPPANWGDRLTMGDPVITEGRIRRGNNPNYGTYKSCMCLVGVGKSVTTPAGQFQNCTVVDWQLTEDYGNGPRIDWVRAWLVPMVGPVNAEERHLGEGQTLPSSSSKLLRAGVLGIKPVGTAQNENDAYGFVLRYARVGSREYGERPTMNHWDAMKMAAGNARRLSGGPTQWRVESVEGQLRLGSISGWAIMDAHTWDIPQVDEFMTLLCRNQSGEIQLLGAQADPKLFGKPTVIKGNQPASVPAVLPMGEVYSTAEVTLLDDSTGQVLGKAKWTRALVGRAPVDTPAGKFDGCWVVQELQEMKEGSQTEWKASLSELSYDEEAGLVAETLSELGTPWSGTVLLEWARVGSRTWGNVGRFDIAEYWPLNTGNKWRLGENQGFWQQGEVKSPQNLGQFRDAVPLLWQTGFGGQQREQWTEYYSAQQNAVLLVAQTPEDYPRPVMLRNPLPYPRPWALGQVVRHASEYYDPTNPTVKAPMSVLAVPIRAGVRVETPAGTFDNCVELVELNAVQPPGNNWEWVHRHVLLAPGVGPVELHWRPGEEDHYIGPGSLLWAIVDGVKYGPAP